MCGYVPNATASQSASQPCPAAEKSARGYTALACPACRLLAHLGLTRRKTARVEDLYSSSVTTAPSRPALRETKRFSRPIIAEPERDAA